MSHPLGVLSKLSGVGLPISKPPVSKSLKNRSTPSAVTSRFYMINISVGGLEVRFIADVVVSLFYAFSRKRVLC